MLLNTALDVYIITAWSLYCCLDGSYIFDLSGTYMYVQHHYDGHIEIHRIPGTYLVLISILKLIRTHDKTPKLHVFSYVIPTNI